MQIWPAIDIRDGKCVRLIQGDYEQETIYGNSPADMAHRFVADGAKFLHVVDLDGARDGSSVNESAIARIVNEVDATIQVGGGIRSDEAIQRYLDIGVEKLVIGTKALTDPQWLSEMTRKYPHKLAVGIDARKGNVAIEGWKTTSDTSAYELAAKMASQPIAAIVFTDITRDGMLSGPNFDAMRQMKSSVDVPIVCSGGVTTVEDIARLASLGLAGCIIGKALYEGHLSLSSAFAAAKPETSQNSLEA